MKRKAYALVEVEWNNDVSDEVEEWVWDTILQAGVNTAAGDVSFKLKNIYADKEDKLVPLAVTTRKIKSIRSI